MGLYPLIADDLEDTNSETDDSAVSTVKGKAKDGASDKESGRLTRGAPIWLFTDKQIIDI